MQLNSTIIQVRYVHLGETVLLALTFITCSTMAYCISQVNYVVSEKDCLLFSDWRLSPHEKELVHLGIKLLCTREKKVYRII